MKALVLWKNIGHEKAWLKLVLSQAFTELIESRNVNDLLKEDFSLPLFVIINNPLPHRFSELTRSSRPFFLINLGDEFIPSKQDHTIYDHPLCQHVFRNYYRGADDSACVTAFALGYGYPFTEGISHKELALRRLLGNRKYIWSFAGVGRKSGRRKTLSRLKDFKPYFCHETSGWMTSDALSGPRYRELLLNSFVIPAPRGNCNLDSFRLYEALEAGCIPLLEKSSPIQDEHYFSNLLGANCPLLSLPDLGSSDGFLHEIATNIIFREETRVSILKWWESHKNLLSQRFLKTSLT